MTIPFWCVFASFLLIYGPRLIVAAGQAKRPEGFDNRHPRDQQAKLEGWARRANAAHMNAFEAFAPFAAAVVVNHLAGGAPGTAATLALIHVAARVVYVACYVGNVDKLRSAVWMVGFGATAALFLAGLAN